MFESCFKFWVFQRRYELIFSLLITTVIYVSLRERISRKKNAVSLPRSVCKTENSNNDHGLS